MKFKDLSKTDKEIFKLTYKKHTKKIAQEKLADYFGKTPRTIRSWAKDLGLNILGNPLKNEGKILIYDLETSLIDARLFWTGKQYVGHKQVTNEPRIITVAWKWYGEDTVYYLKWDKDHSDVSLVEEFLQFYNEADMVIGVNNNSFDNRWLNARSFKYGFDVNVFVKSLDIQKQAKKLFRLPSYSMDYLAKFLEVTHKQTTEGRVMWEKIERGTLKEQEEYMEKMVDYNIGDIVTTEEIFLKMRKYIGHVTHMGTLNDEPKYSCPHCGGLNVELLRTMTTAAGTLQRVMRCKDDESQYKISNTEYLKFVENE